MHATDPLAHLIIPANTSLFHHLQCLVRDYRWVFVAGLPGTGKSLCIQQLAHLASASGRSIHLLQWDRVRPIFEASPAGKRYLVVQGITHAVIRKAIGLWVRTALTQWRQRYSEPHHMLIGEIPCIGYRFIDLARRLPDTTEALLTHHTSVFVIPVPSLAVRRFIEVQRHRRSVAPLHNQEREDAPPHVLQALWDDLVRVAPRLGVPRPAHATHLPYDPHLYQQAYQALLKHRHTQVLALGLLLPTTDMSVYDFALSPSVLTPKAHEIVRCIREVEQGYPDVRVLQREVDHWYVV